MPHASRKNQRISWVAAGLLTCLACSFGLSAAPLPSDFTGTSRLIKVSTSGTGAYPLNNGGGGFAGTVWKGDETTDPSLSTTMWCVDSQLYFSNNNMGLANIVLLADLPSDKVRYGELAGSLPGTSPGWTNYLGAAVFDAAQVRFQMAAWLVQQYTSNPAFPSGPTPSNDPPSIAIQQAIWAIINNNTPGYDTAGFSTINSTTSPWIEMAKNNYSSVGLTQWAVVSWLVNGPLGEFHGDDKQTFLVQVLPPDDLNVVPEPGFYALLGFGLIALFMLHKRRRSDSEPFSQI